jgi:hypothetical protein
MRIADLTPGTPASRTDLTKVRKLASASAISALENGDVSGNSSKLGDIAVSAT